MKNPLKRSDDNDKSDDDKKKDQMRRSQAGFGLTYLIVGLIFIWLFQQFILAPLIVQQTEIPYSQFKDMIKSGQIVNLTLSDTQITGTMKVTPTGGGTPTDQPFITYPVPNGDPTLIQQLDSAGIQYDVAPPPSAIGTFLISYVLPMVIIGGIFYLLYRQLFRAGGVGGGSGGIFGVAKSKASEVKPEDVNVTYKDVGGADEAIDELREIIQFLKTPEKFARLGGRIPKGVLLVGPPGTGKTLLAKATAGEAQVPFFETSGSEFIEMFVGVGAARVRDLFDQARAVAPAVIFIDEIDAIGQSRGSNVRFGANDEREQTLNQLLSEIDGFDSITSKPVIIMAATNRPEILDPALLRAGRFDREVTVSAPDLTGRIQILQIHSKNIKLAPDFAIERAARITPGFTGADLANVMNEAALLAARRNGDAVSIQDYEAAIERVVAGLEKKSRIMNEKERTTVAYHESGHAIVAELVPQGEPVAKISIVPHGRGALGYTMQMPTEDRYLMTREELEDHIATMLGGRAAEMVMFNEISTGASDDIKRATELARRMVTEYGMSDKLGAVRYSNQQYQFLESEETTATASQQTLKTIDEEVQRIIEQQYKRAQALLSGHRTALEDLAKQLLSTETVDGEAVKQVLRKEEATSIPEAA